MENRKSVKVIFAHEEDWRQKKYGDNIVKFKLLKIDSISAN